MRLNLLHECTTTGAIAIAPNMMRPAGMRKRRKKYFAEDHLIEKKGSSRYLPKGQPKTLVWQPFEGQGKTARSSKGSVASFATDTLKGNPYDPPDSPVGMMRDPMGKKR